MITLTDLEKRIERLEFHQRLLIEYIHNPAQELSKYIVTKGITKDEYMAFTSLCQTLSKKWETEKREESVYFTPLFREFVEGLPSSFTLDVIDVCLTQGLYVDIMRSFKKHLN